MINRRWILISALLCLTPTLAFAQKKPVVKKHTTKPVTSVALPSPDKILARFIDVTGGKASYEKLKSQSMSGTLELKAQGVTGTFSISTKDPNKYLMIQNLSGVGTMKAGFNGKVAWSQDPFTGVRALEGAELEQQKISAQFNSQLKWKEIYKKVETLGMSDVNGVKAYKVRFTPKVGPQIIQFYAIKSGLLIRQDMVVQSPQGEMPVQASMSDYRAIDGVKVPFLVKQKIARIAELVMTVTEVKNNTDIEDSVFEKPSDTEKPADAEKPADPAKPAEDPKPGDAAKPAEPASK